MLTRFSTAVIITTCFPIIGIASPNPFGSSKEECMQISEDKYEADSDYFQQQLYVDETALLNAAQDVHRIELQSCSTTMFF